MRFSRAGLAALWLLTCLALAYLPDIGRGFVSDDFSWIYVSRVQTLDDLWRPLRTTPTGFYRPIVSWSFALNYALAGLSAMPYALTNFALVLATMTGIVLTGRRWRLPSYAALLAAAFWSLNFHGIGMALTWISGRTSLLASVFAVLAGLATTTARPIIAGALTLAALLSKEEPILLPLILAIWVALERQANGATWRDSLRDACRATWPSFVALASYIGLRLNTLAFTPWAAPDVYRVTFSPRTLFTNVLEYADRSSTFAAAVLLLGWLLFSRRRMVLSSREWLNVKKGLVWLVLGFGATVFVPVRSDLYACFPSIGGALAGASIATALWRTMPVTRRRTASLALLALPVLLLPIYRARNAPSREDARLSVRVVREVSEELYRHQGATKVVIYENAQDRNSVSAAFRGTLPRAIELASGRTPTIEIRPVGTRLPEERAESGATLSFVFTGRGVD